MSKWDKLLDTTKTIAAIAGPVADAVAKLVKEWDEAPPEAASQRRAAMLTLRVLDASKDGALDRDDLRDLEAPGND